jgi:hypothetical protein
MIVPLGEGNALLVPGRYLESCWTAKKDSNFFQVLWVVPWMRLFHDGPLSRTACSIPCSNCFVFDMSIGFFGMFFRRLILISSALPAIA